MNSWKANFHLERYKDTILGNKYFSCCCRYLLIRNFPQRNWKHSHYNLKLFDDVLYLVVYGQWQKQKSTTVCDARKSAPKPRKVSLGLKSKYSNMWMPYLITSHAGYYELATNALYWIRDYPILVTWLKGLFWL